MNVHANRNCPHDDVAVLPLRRQYGIGNYEGVLREIARLRNWQPELNGYQQEVVVLHEATAQFMLGTIDVEKFMERSEDILVNVLAMGNFDAAADILMSRIRLLGEAGHRDLAYRQLAGFFDRMPRTARLEALMNMAQASLLVQEGNHEAAMRICREALGKFYRQDMPCVFELISAQLARLLEANGQPAEAREMLRAANIPDELIDERLAMPI